MRTVGAGGHHPARSIFEPLKILTGEGCSPVAEWLSTVSESNMVASGMDRVGEFDPGEVIIVRTLRMEVPSVRGYASLRIHFFCFFSI